MSTEPAIRESIERASQAVGTVWPLHSFVTANPLAGYEDRPFHEAVQQAEDRVGGDGYPSASTFRAAYERGAIDEARLTDLLSAHGYEADPDTLLDRMAAGEGEESSGDLTPSDRVDGVLVKWLEAFLDQGQAQWRMPDRENGFYAAFCNVAPHDSAIPDNETLTTLPDSPATAIKGVLSDVPPGDWQDRFEAHLTALPGWTGLIKQRADDDDQWQAAAPITLTDYLAVRLVLTEQFDAPLEPEQSDTSSTEAPPLAELWLQAWEQSHREELVETLTDESARLSDNAGNDTTERPAAQLVFCIDTRSEIIRRHIESAGAYETHGYAGFFGIPMRHQRYDEDVIVDACPPIVDAQHRIDDTPADACETTASHHDRRAGLVDAGKHLLKAVKKNAATAFSYVESAGSAYGVALATRTLAPGLVADVTERVDDTVPDAHEFCKPTLDHGDGDGPLSQGLTHEKKVEYAATAFELMGIEEFARLVVFTGHASETANNPFDSSLDCGACAGNPGGPNARVLAAICNDDAVKASLRERGIDVPDDTHFLAAEHNTTTDDIELFDGSVPESHREDIDELADDLASAQRGAAAERAEMMGVDAEDPVRETERRAADWAETRPEWGLAGNASFVVGPRELTADLDLDGRAFLHSYDWQTDPDGDALEAILTGPMVVTQWINNQYYFATVDTSVYGSGSKITQNPVGNVGIVQGNGGDLMTGLPLQSLTNGADDPYHQPLRLSTVVHAPREQVESILAAHENLATLLDNGWLSLTVVDPQRDAAFEYTGELAWEQVHEIESVNRQQAPTMADD